MSKTPSRALRGASLLLLTTMLGLSGCGSFLTAASSDVAGVAGAGLANTVTKSGAIATGIGLGVAAGANYGLQYTERVVHRAEQDQIASAAGQLPPGLVGYWHVVHTVPIENDEHGEVVVTRLIGDDSFRCKEIVFSVDTTEKKETRRAFYTAAVCQDGQNWKWASAEPATARWGSLQ
jgi:hypothetical protein